MIKSRYINEDDKRLLEEALKDDEFHKNTTVEFFYDPRTMGSVYEDEEGPVFYVRGAKALRLDIQFVSNRDFKRNARTMLAGFSRLAEQAKNAGFSEIIFNSTNTGLKKFCMKYFGFVESEGELRKFL